MREQEWTIPAQANQAPDIRILQLDVLRGLAVLGIYLINVISFGLPNGAYPFPVLLGQAHEANIAFWAFSEVFVEGTMRGLFSMLFGASAMVFLSEAKLASHGLELVDRYYRRTLLLILFGLIHAYLLLWPFDVLYAYGLFGLFLFPLRKLRAATLLVIGSLLLVLGDIELYRTGPDISTELSAPVKDEAMARDRQWYLESVLTELEDDTNLHRSGYREIFVSQIDDVIDQQSTYILQSSYLRHRRHDAARHGLAEAGHSLRAPLLAFLFVAGLRRLSDRRYCARLRRVHGTHPRL